MKTDQTSGLDRYEALGEPVAAAHQPWVLLGINALYVGFGLIMGVVNGGMPAIMRDQGLSIASTGWLYLLYLPFGLTFLWAPMIDRVGLPLISRRLGWIVAMQSAAILLLILIALSEGIPWWQLFGLGLLVSLAIATMDLALDAMAVKTILPAWRPVASATKLAALSLGAMLGGGGFVGFFDQLGWQNAFLLLSMVMGLLLLFALPLGRFDAVSSQPDSSHGRASLLKLLSVADSRRRVLLLTLTCCIIFPLAGLNRLMLIDLGVSIQQVGWIVGTLGPLTMMATSAVSIPLMKLAGLTRTMSLFAAVSLLSLVAMGYGFLQLVPTLAMAGAIAIGAGVSGIYVTVAAKILGWSEGAQPATDYAAYYGISRFASTLVTVGAASLISLIGWGLFYAIGALALLLVISVLRHLYSEE
ncbi:MAG: MFS transporter [Vreelandella alkaliphila]|uniref:MFS transporter n=2 Tax=Gammaproteobacteria TaxID=1236 RepID=UPI000E929326|nr:MULTISPECIES: MFS transporter [unclassified Halomonas]WKD28307.1 MFS transporter [Halomonas sp. KG2]HBP40160.1 hypothetical protein [Halomonas sp.]HBS82031.1 hypothetical protein [Halomonas campaniensis]